MTNPVERLWDALHAGDLDRARSELHPHVVVEWPHTGERFEGTEPFLAVHRAIPGGHEVEVLRVVTQGRLVATDVRISSQDAAWGVASFFTLHDGRILHAVEYWVDVPAA